MKYKVYIETSVISYLVANPSRDLVVAAQQEITRQWWNIRREDFAIVASELVLEEAGRGDAELSRKRIEVLDEIPLLPVNEAVLELAEAFVAKGGLSEKSSADAIHIAMATVHKVDFLLTWNCSHIANAEIQKVLTRIARQYHYDLPFICTPNELMGELENEP